MCPRMQTAMQMMIELESNQSWWTLLMHANKVFSHICTMHKNKDACQTSIRIKSWCTGVDVTVIQVGPA